MLFGLNIRISKDVIFARAAFGDRLALLFAFDKIIEVDRAQRVIRVTSRSFWFFNSNKRISFDRIKDIETKASIRKDNARNEHVTYSILLWLDNPWEKYTLISFRDFSRVNFEDSILNENSVFSGEEAFQEYFDLLKKDVKKIR